MKRRCADKNNSNWKNYGARGIKVCDRWQVFENFAADMGEPGEKQWLDRIDVNGNYEPANCRWCSYMESGKNQRRVRFLTINGETLHLSEWTRRTGIYQATLLRRKAQGKTDAEMLAPPRVRAKNTLPKVKKETRRDRLNTKVREIAFEMGISL